jgi:hypothetical protein
MALAAGESQKVSQGLYENYLESKVKDHHMINSVTTINPQKVLWFA